MIYYDTKSSIFHPYTTIAHTQKGICAILIGLPYNHDIDDELEIMFPTHQIQSVYSPQFAQTIIRQLEHNTNIGKIPIDIQCGTPFQKLVWENLRKIKPGTTITYSGLAAKIGLPRTIRGVATACGANPISILIPCHRVIPKTGGIGKYRWGTEMKQILLEREKAVL